MAVLSEVMEVTDGHSEDCNTEECEVTVSTVFGDNGCASLEEMLMELMKDTSLSSHHQDLLLALLIDYSDVFAWSRDELGHTDVLQYEIITDGVAPIHQ